MNELIGFNSEYSPEEKEAIRNNLAPVCSRFVATNISHFTPSTPNIIGYSIDYVMEQDNAFKRIYADQFVSDCRFAYNSRNADSQQSCMGGVVERAYMMLLKTAQISLSMKDEHSLSPEKEHEYSKLASFIPITIEFILEKAREWKVRDDVPKGKDARIESIRRYLISEAEKHKIALDEENVKEIDKFARYSIDDDGDFAFGGRKKAAKKSKTKKAKKSKAAKKSKTKNAKKSLKKKRQTHRKK